MVTITAHDGDASINEDIVLSVDDQSECKIYLVSRHLFAKMLTLTVIYLCTIGPDCLFQLEDYGGDHVSRVLVLKAGSSIPEEIIRSRSMSVVVKVRSLPV